MNDHLYEIAVVGHVDRWNRARDLANRVGSTCLTIDDGHLGAGGNHLRAWRWLADGHSEWSIILEDDAIPSGWFLSDLKDVLNNSPTPVVSLYLGRKRPPHWQGSIASVIGSGKSWLMANELLHHVAVAVKTSIVPVILDDLEETLKTMPIDEAVGARFRRLGVDVSYCNPSIVDHDDSLPTVIKEHVSQHPDETGIRLLNDGRRAWNMIGSSSTWDDSRITIPTPLM